MFARIGLGDVTGDVDSHGDSVLADWLHCVHMIDYLHQELDLFKLSHIISEEEALFNCNLIESGTNLNMQTPQKGPMGSELPR